MNVILNVLNILVDKFVLMYGDMLRLGALGDHGVARDVKPEDHSTGLLGVGKVPFSDRANLIVDNIHTVEAFDQLISL